MIVVSMQTLNTSGAQLNLNARGASLNLSQVNNTQISNF